MKKFYIVLSYYHDGSEPPRLGFATDDEHKIGDLLQYVGSSLKEGKEVNVYEVSDIPKLIYSSTTNAQDESTTI